MNRNHIVTFCNETLNISAFKDYCPNGLQVSGKDHIQFLVSGVSASQALLDAAVQINADMILVHHGYFWKNEDSCMTGIHKKRIKTLLDRDINLLAYHLPLDAHIALGNNAQLARMMNWTIDGNMKSSCGINLGMIGKCHHPITAIELQSALSDKLQHQAMMITNDPQKKIKRIAWCTGAAADDLKYAIEAGVDAFVTGEPVERIYHIAQETGVVFYAAGHHATERYGVQALGNTLAKQFKISHTFIDIPCPI